MGYPPWIVIPRGLSPVAISGGLFPVVYPLRVIACGLSPVVLPPVVYPLLSPEVIPHGLSLSFEVMPHGLSPVGYPPWFIPCVFSPVGYAPLGYPLWVIPRGLTLLSPWFIPRGLSLLPAAPCTARSQPLAARGGSGRALGAGQRLAGARSGRWGRGRAGLPKIGLQLPINRSLLSFSRQRGLRRARERAQGCGSGAWGAAGGWGQR